MCIDATGKRQIEFKKPRSGQLEQKLCLRSCEDQIKKILKDVESMKEAYQKGRGQEREERGPVP